MIIILKREREGAIIEEKGSINIMREMGTESTEETGAKGTKIGIETKREIIIIIIVTGVREIEERIESRKEKEIRREAERKIGKETRNKGEPKEELVRGIEKEINREISIMPILQERAEAQEVARVVVKMSQVPPLEDD